MIKITLVVKISQLGAGHYVGGNITDIDIVGSNIEV